MISIFTVNISFTKSITIIYNISEAIIISIMSIIFWILYYKYKNENYSYNNISFNKILTNSNKTSLMKELKFIINHYYLAIYLSLIVGSLAIVFLRNVGIAVFLLIIVGCIIVIMLNIKFSLYAEPLDSKRCIGNLSVLIFIMLLHIVNYTSSSSLGTGVAIVSISFALLLITLVANAAILILL